MAKNYEELKLSDDFMFGKVMEDGRLCREVLECLLGKPVGELEEMHTQREYRYAMDGKPIRLDIYTRDGETVYDTEMQNLNHKKPEDYDLPRRSRFYQSVMDTDHLKKISHIVPCRRLTFCSSVPLTLSGKIYRSIPSKAGVKRCRSWHYRTIR